MTSKNEKLSTNELGNKIYSDLPKIFTERELEKVVDRYQIEFAFNYPTKSGIINRATKLPLIWNKRGSIALYHLNNDFNELDIVYALNRNLKRAYASHFSALYFNELVGQKPKNHYISQAIKLPLPQEHSQIKALLIMQAFMKEPRITSNFFSLQNNNYYLLEKGDHAMCGVISKSLHFQKQNIELKITDIERTLIDCIMAPHYAGGLTTLLNAYKESSIRISKLKDYYEVLNPQYPYWQSIGLFLDSISSDLGNQWYELFRTRKKQAFFIEHKYNSTWEKSEKWEVFFPRGLRDYFTDFNQRKPPQDPL